MRVLVVTSQWFPDFFGGSGRVAAATAEQLAIRGHDVIVIAPCSERKPARVEENGVRVLRTLPRNALPETLTDVVAAARAVRSLRRESFDVVIAHQAPVAVGVVRAGIPTPLAFVYHASAVRELRFLRSRLPLGRHRLTSYLLELPLALFERAAVKHASRILALSEFSRSLLLTDHVEHAGQKIVRVLGGVDVTQFAPMDNARERVGVTLDTKLVVTARRLEPRMGVEELLYALASLASVNLVVIGKGMLEEELRRLACSIGVEERVRFVGGVDDGELRSWYAAADVVVMPTAAYEGFGLVTAEALACGTPVVATPIGASPELLAPLDSRLIAKGVEADDLAEALGRAIGAVNPGVRARCREYATERFAWEIVMDDWERALELSASAFRGAAAAA